MAEYLEIERKFDVPPEFAVPDLSDVPGCAGLSGPRAEHLAAAYFDTGDLRLTRYGVTLRRRSGGSDAGWHLKLPVARGTRREIHAPLGAKGAEGAGQQQVPSRLAGLVAAYVRGCDLRQVATIETDRRVLRLVDDNGETLAEVADDRVTAEVAEDLAAGAAGDMVTAEAADDPVPASVAGAAGYPVAAETADGRVMAGAAHRPGRMQWREVEVELGSGAPSLLAAVGKRLLAAGARPSAAESKLARLLGGGRRQSPPRRYQTAGDVVVSYVAAQVATILEYDPKVRLADDDAVHQMRVAVRRIRSVLRAYRPLLDRDRTDPLDAELKWLAGILGTVRDLEVLRARFAGRIGELGQQPPEWLGKMARQQSAAHARLIRALREQRYFGLLDALERFAADPPLTDAAGAAARTVKPLVSHAWWRVGRSFARIDGSASEDDRAAARHSTRKAAKRARYAAEAARPVLGGQAKVITVQAERLQEVLGTYVDGVIAQQRLAQMSDGSREAFLLGMVAGVEHCAAERTLDDVAAVRVKATKPKYARQLKRA